MSNQRPDRTHLLAQRRQFLLTLAPLELTGLIIDYGIQLDEDSNCIELILEHEFGSGLTSGFVSQRVPGDARPTHTELDSTVVQELKSGDVSKPTVEIPVCLGDFRVLREVGKGGMGIVYEAFQESLGRRVALKILPPHLTPDDTSVQRFERESYSAASLHHTNIVPVFGVGEKDGLHYYVMQFIDGCGLGEVLSEMRRLCNSNNGTTSDIGSLGASTQLSESVYGQESLKTRSHAQRIAESLLLGRFAHDSAEAAAADGAETVADPNSPVSSDELLDGSTVITNRPVPVDDLPVDSHITKPFHQVKLEEDATEGGPPDEPPQSRVKLNRRYWLSVAQTGVQVADALDYAHGFGVLHRDIKPSNLLIDASGTVWVADFGLAKASGSDDLTLTGEFVGTVRYMAPETFSGEGDIRSDIYSLGLTLYELLTHYPAFREQDQHRLLRQVLDDEPPRPRQLRPDIPRDLETIVLKAIAREPAHRYQTPREMADDLRRFLLDKPISARQANYVERARRWCRRNPVVAGLSAALFVLSISSFISVVWLWRDAEHERRLSVSAGAQAREDRDTAVDALQETQQQRAAAVAASKEAQRAIEAAIQAETDALASEAKVRKKLEQLQATLADFERVRQLDEKRITNRPTEADYQAVLASNFHNLAGLQYATGKTTEAIKSYQNAIVELCLLIADHPRKANYHDGLAASYHSLARVHQEIGNPNEAMHNYAEAISVRRALFEQDTMSAAFRSALANCLYDLAELQRKQAQNDEANRNLLEAFQHREKLVVEHPKDPRFRRHLAVTCLKLGQLNESLGKNADGINFYRQAVEHWQSVVNARPPAMRHQLAYADACRRLGDAVRVATSADMSIQWYSKSIRILDSVLASQAQNAEAAELITTVHQSQAAAFTEVGEHEQAVAELDRALMHVTEAKRNRIRTVRALALARAGDHQVATFEANSIADTKDLPVELIYMSAKVLAVAAVTVGNDKSIDNDIQGGLAKQYANQAVGHLQACKQANFFADRKNVEKLVADTEFRHLLERRDVKSLLGER